MYDWLVTYYDDEVILSTHIIENRDEHQAEHEAIADMPIDCNDWSMIKKE